MHSSRVRRAAHSPVPSLRRRPRSTRGRRQARQRARRELRAADHVMLAPAEFVFWSCLGIGLYPYAGYPLCVALLRAIRPRPVRAAPILPRVTVVISAYNEASHIDATVRNKLDQDSPRPLLDAMVVSDRSTDGTDRIPTTLAPRHPRLPVRQQDPRAGKQGALDSMLEP